VSRRLAFVALALAVPSIAYADRRSFTRTYEYQTMPDGETELEIYSTHVKQHLGDGPSVREYELMLEVEHGITDRWDVSLYHVFEQSSGPATEDNESFHFSEIKLRTRYRFSDRGEWPVDVLLYAEGVKVFGAGIWEGEGKVILARDISDLTIAVNAIGEVKIDPAADEPEVEAGWAAGLTYELTPEWKLGGESWGAAEVEHTDELAAYAGPAASWAPSTSFWITGTTGFGLTDHSDDFSVRLLLGLHIQ
jgi:hypothetical protein